MLVMIFGQIFFPERFNASLDAGLTLEGAIGNGTLLRSSPAIFPTERDGHQKIEKLFPDFGGPQTTARPTSGIKKATR
jgi:hypothetical protein